MKTIKFNDKSYQVPQNWSEVTIRQQQLAESLSNTQQYVKILGIISAYTQIPLEELRQAPTDSLIGMMNCLDFMDTPISKEMIYKFTFKGDEYNISTSMLQQQFQDYVACQTAILEYPEDNWKQLSYLVAIMAKKTDETLDDFDINARAEYLMDLDVETVNRVSAFFLFNKKISDYHTVLYSPEILKLSVQNKVQQLEVTLKTLQRLRGKNFLIRLWIGILRKYMTYLLKQLEKYLNSPVSNNSKMNWMQYCKKFLWKNRKPKVNK